MALCCMPLQPKAYRRCPPKQVVLIPGKKAVTEATEGNMTENMTELPNLVCKHPSKSRVSLRGARGGNCPLEVAPLKILCPPPLEVVGA